MKWFVKRHSGWLWVLLVVPLVIGIVRLRFDIEILNLLPGDLPVVQGLKIYQKSFSNARELIVTIQSETAEQTEQAARALARVLREQTNLVSSLTWQPAWMEKPGEATELVAAMWLNQPPSAVAALKNRLSSTNLERVLAETRSILSSSFSPLEIGQRGYDPYALLQLPEFVMKGAPAFATGDDLFASENGTFRMVFVQARSDIASYRDCRDWLSKIQTIVKSAQSSGEIPMGAKLAYTGRPPFVTEIAGGMENDMIGSSLGTLATIGLLFWLSHRRLRPLFWLLLMLVLILGATTALGGLVIGRINVVSMGFASILLGLAEDFGIVIYQECRSHPELNARQLRKEVAPGIFWSTITTAGAFFILFFSVLPGMAQLGTLVAIGIVLAMVFMLYAFLPILLHIRRQSDRSCENQEAERYLLFSSATTLPPRLVWVISVFLLLGSTAIILQSGPTFNHSPNVLKPQKSEASEALDQIKQHFSGDAEPLWVIIPGSSEMEVERKLAEVNSVLSNCVSQNLIVGYTLPTVLWPNAENQHENRPTIQALLRQRGEMRATALREGFATNSLFTMESLFDHWERALKEDAIFWPTNSVSSWILSKVAVHEPKEFLALGLIRPIGRSADMKLSAEWPESLRKQGVLLSGWVLLGTTVFDTVLRELPGLLLPIFALVCFSLWFAFRSIKEVILSLVALSFTGLLLQCAMSLLGWEWNLLNLIALPLLLGMGVDFGIHMQLALKRHSGDRLAVRRSVGRALLLAGATTVAGFASLAFSTNSGMASLGKVCGLGILLALLVSVYLLPVWWQYSKLSEWRGK